MGEQTKQTFLEKLTLKYPDHFEVVKNGRGIYSESAIFSAKNKRFGNIIISGGLHQWEDEDDYDEVKFDDDNYLENGGDFQDYCEDISLDFQISGIAYLLTPTQIFEYLEGIFADKLLLFWTWKPWQRRYNHLYDRSDFEKMIHKGKIRVAKNYKICLWSGNYPLKQG